MASLKEIMNVDDDHADHHAHPLKRIMEPGPRPPSGPENSLPSPRHIFASDYSTTSALTHRRSPSLPFPRSTRAASSSSSTANATAVTEADRRRSNASAESMDSSQGNTYMSDRSPSSGPTMRPNLPSTTLGDATVKLTPITGRVSRAKKGIPVHVCDLCHPPKSFTRAEHLRRHQLSHSAPGLVCPVPGCDKSFYREDLLRRHQLRHEQDDTAASYTQPVGLSSSDLYASSATPLHDDLVPLTPRATTSSRAHHGHARTLSSETWPTHAVPGTHQRTNPMLSDLSSHSVRNQDSSSLAWPDTTTSLSSGSSSTFTSPSSTRRLAHLAERPSATAWSERMPLASTELPTSTAYVSAPFSYGTSSSALYETPLSDHMGVPMSSYHDESPLYGSRDLANSTVRSLSPRTAVARLSETLVTAPTALSPDRLVEPAVYGWQPGVEYRPRIATAEDLAPSTLSSALRAAVPSYVEIFWERVAPVCGIVHRPSLEAAVTDSKQRDVLTCAMAAVAAQHLDTAEDRVNANHLHAYAAYHAKTHATTQPWPPAIMQSVYLCEYYARYRGRKQGSHTASTQFQQLYQMVTDTHNTNSTRQEGGSIEERWISWVMHETRKRVLAACFWLDVMCSRYYEQYPTKVQGLDYSSPLTLPILLPATTARLWNAQTARDWADLLSQCGKSKTLAEVSLEDSTERDIRASSPFDRAILLAAFTLHLTRRRSLNQVVGLDTVLDMEPAVGKIGSLFSGSGPANAALALHHTPLYFLLSVSGDSWVFNKKVPRASSFADHRRQLKEWCESANASVAMAFAARALKILLTPCIHVDASSEAHISPTWDDLSDFWVVYVCTLIFWAYGSGKVKTNEEQEPTILDAWDYLTKVALLGPQDIQDQPDRQKARSLVALTRHILQKDCLGGRTILMADALNVLRKLEGGGMRDWMDQG